MVALSTKESRFCFDLLPIFSQTAFFTIAWHSDQRRTLRRVGALNHHFAHGDAEERKPGNIYNRISSQSEVYEDASVQGDTVETKFRGRFAHHHRFHGRM